MPIIGLTDRQAELPRIGILRKGGKKVRDNAPGPDLDYFRFVADDDETAMAFANVYGLQPRQINVFLPFPTVDQNWEAWKEEWKASALQHRCDGQTCVLWLRRDGSYSTEPRPCPGGCKQVGRLKVVIPELARYAIVTVLTTGKWDVMNLDASLKALDQIKSAPTLQGIPLVIRRVEREISTPRGDGKRARVKKWLLQIEARTTWVAAQLQAAERAALPGVQLQLAPGPSGVIEADDHAPEEDDSDEAIGGDIVPPGFALEEDDALASASPAAASGLSESERIDRALLEYCKTQKGAKNGPAFFQAQYGAKSLEQKRAIAQSLGLISAPALDVAEEAVTEASVVAEIEALFTALTALGKSGSEISGQVARMCDGETDLQDMPLNMLVTLRDGLAFWRDQTRSQLTKGAGK